MIPMLQNPWARFMILTSISFSIRAANTFSDTCAKGNIDPQKNGATNSDGVPDARLGKTPALSIGTKTINNARRAPSFPTVRPAT